MDFDKYKNNFEQMLITVVYDMMRLQSKMLLPVGLELNSMNIYLEGNHNFALKDMTFAYYDAIDNSIRINIEHPVFKNCTNKQDQSAKLFLTIFHEAMHKILMHVPNRLNNRNSMLWNVACDYEIHNMLYIYLNGLTEQSDVFIMKQYFDYINRWVIKQEFEESETNPRLLFSEDYLDLIAEEIYELLNDAKNQSQQTSNINISGVDVKVTETTYKLPDGKTIKSVDIEWPPEAQLPDHLKKSDDAKELEQHNAECNKTLLENAMSQLAKEKGEGSNKVSKFLKKLFHIKVDWEKILRNSLQTALEKSDYFAWSKIRTSTFLMPGMSYLPDIIDDDNAYGTLIISRDESGSMTDEMVAKAGAVIKEAKAHYKKIIFISHDSKITSINEFEEVTDDIFNSLLERKSCGGTSHKDVFEYIREYRINNRDDKISCYIGITDMESDIEKTQKIIPSDIPVIYLVPMKYTKESYNEIKGKVIPVEL